MRQLLLVSRILQRLPKLLLRPTHPSSHIKRAHGWRKQLLPSLAPPRPWAEYSIVTVLQTAVGCVLVSSGAHTAIMYTKGAADHTTSLPQMSAALMPGVCARGMACKVQGKARCAHSPPTGYLELLGTRRPTAVNTWPHPDTHHCCQACDLACIFVITGVFQEAGCSNFGCWKAISASAEHDAHMLTSFLPVLISSSVMASLHCWGMLKRSRSLGRTPSHLMSDRDGSAREGTAGRSGTVESVGRCAKDSFKLRAQQKLHCRPHSL